MTKLDEYLNEIESELCDSEVRVYDKENETFFTIKNNVKDIETLLKIVRVQQRIINDFSPLIVSSVEKEIQLILEERSK